MTMTSFRPRLLRPLLIAVIGSGLPFSTVQAGAGHDHPDSAAPPAKVAAAKAGAAPPRPGSGCRERRPCSRRGAQGEGEERHAEGEIELSAEQIRAAGIETQVVAPVNVGASLSLPGEIRFDEDRTAHVVSRTPGIVEQVKANLGDQVRKGQVLAVIASEQLSEVRSELATAQQRLQLARTLYAREQNLWQERISAEQDLLQARQTLQEAEIAVRNARQKAQALGGAASAQGGSRYELRAPFDGVVVEKHLVLGERVDETSNLFTLTTCPRLGDVRRPRTRPRSSDHRPTGGDRRRRAGQSHRGHRGARRQSVGRTDPGGDRARHPGQSGRRLAPRSIHHGAAR